MSLTLRFRTLSLAAMAAAALALSACGGGNSADGGTTGGATTGGTTGGATGNLYIAFDGGGDVGSTDIYAANLGSRVGGFNTGLNEGIADNSGTLNAVGVIGGQATLRRFPDFAARAGGSFDLAQDDSFQYPAIRAPRGIAVAGLTNGQLIVADAPAATTGEDLTSVPSLHLLTTVVNLAPPTLLATISVSTASGRTWDVAYDAFVDRLFAAMTNGSVAVYDNFVSRATLAGIGSGSAVTPSRLITPGVVTGGVSAKTSVNLHGISYNRATNQLVVSDVGDAASDSDGAIYVIDAASTASNAAVGGGAAIVSPSREIRGASTLLGNPVDVLLRSDGNLYVAEKLNGGGQILVFNGILDGSSGDIAPNLHVTTDSLGSSGDPESIAAPN